MSAEESKLLKAIFPDMCLSDPASQLKELKDTLKESMFLVEERRAIIAPISQQKEQSVPAISKSVQIYSYDQDDHPIILEKQFLVALLKEMGFWSYPPIVDTVIC